MSGIIRSFATILLAVCAGAGAARAQTLKEAAVPCRENMNLEFLRPCDAVYPKINSNSLEIVQAKVKEHYDDDGSMGWKALVAVRKEGEPLTVNACSLIPIPTLGIPAEGADSSSSSVNHVSRPCGDFCHTEIDITIDFLGMAGKTLSYIACSFVDWLPGVDCPPPPSLDDLFEVKEDTTAPRCVREDAFARGAYIQALECSRRAVEQEILAGKLQITRPAEGVEGACEPLARDILGYSQQGSGVASKLVANLGESRTLIGALDQCEDPNGGQDTLMSACYLSAGRLAIESTFGSLATCEIFSRAHRVWTSKFSSDGPIITRVSNAVKDTCIPRCKKKFGLDVPNKIEAKIQECVTSCYREMLVSELRTALETEFPLAGCAP